MYGYDQFSTFEFEFESSSRILALSKSSKASNSRKSAYLSPPKPHDDHPTFVSLILTLVKCMHDLDSLHELDPSFLMLLHSHPTLV
jgi:hypothetical protein